MEQLFAICKMIVSVPCVTWDDHVIVCWRTASWFCLLPFPPLLHHLISSTRLHLSDALKPPATHLAILYADRRDRRKSPGVPGAAIAI